MRSSTRCITRGGRIREFVFLSLFGIQYQCEIAGFVRLVEIFTLALDVEIRDEEWICAVTVTSDERAVSCTIIIPSLPVLLSGFNPKLILSSGVALIQTSTTHPLSPVGHSSEANGVSS